MYRAGGPIGALDYVVRSASGYVHYASDGHESHFDKHGRLMFWRSPQGEFWRLHYSATQRYPIERNLTHAVHSSGRAIYFEFPADAWQVMPASRVWDTAGNVYTYTYTPMQYSWPEWGLATVTYPAGTSDRRLDLFRPHVISYEYQLANLTGKFINGVRYSTFRYDSQERVISSEHAGGHDRMTFEYIPRSFGSRPKTRVTNALGRSTTLSFDNDGQVVASEGAASSFCPAMSTNVITDKAARTRTITDENGYVTRERYDATGNVIESIRGFGTADPQITTFSWDSNPVRIKQITTQTFRETATYTATNRLSSVTVEDLTAFAAPPRTKEYRYLEANGLIVSRITDGPISGTGDTITEAFNAQGDLASIATSSGTTTFSNHNGLGLPGAVTHPNGLTEWLSYDARGKVITVQRLGRTARYAYLASGELGESLDFHGARVTYNYGPSLRLESVEWSDTFRAASLGGSSANQGKSYEYDLAGNLTRETQWGVGLAPTAGVAVQAPPPPPPRRICGRWRICFLESERVPTVAAQSSLPLGPASMSNGATVALVTSYFYDEAGRMRGTEQSNGQGLTYLRHPGGQVHTVSDSTGRVLERKTYDNHWRLARVDNAKNHSVAFRYDSNNRVTEVRDPRGLVTTYQYDGFGNLRQLTSPDSGATTFGYDSAGQRISESRSDGSHISFAYLPDGRLRSENASRGGMSTLRTYSYDHCAGGAGLICSINESTGEYLSYEYTPLQKLATQSSTIAGVTLTTRWAYDPGGVLTQLTYPNPS